MKPVVRAGCLILVLLFCLAPLCACTQTRAPKTTPPPQTEPGGGPSEPQTQAPTSENPGIEPPDEGDLPQLVCDTEPAETITVRDWIDETFPVSVYDHDYFLCEYVYGFRRPMLTGNSAGVKAMNEHFKIAWSAPLPPADDPIDSVKKGRLYRTLYNNLKSNPDPAHTDRTLVCNHTLDLDYDLSEQNGLIAICLTDTFGIYESEGRHFAAFYAFDPATDSEIDLDTYLSRFGATRRSLIEQFYQTDFYPEWSAHNYPQTFEDEELIGVIFHKNGRTLYFDAPGSYGGVQSVTIPN